MKTLGRLLLLAGAASMAFAGPLQVPEIDGGLATSALALLAGSLMILRGKLRR